MKLLWCVTGAGHFLRESAAICSRRDGVVDVAFSRAGREVADTYGVLSDFQSAAASTYFEEEQGWSAPLSAKVASGAYACVVVAPASANTVAKLCAGIADSLITNVASQAAKARIPVYVLPTDVAEAVETQLPSGKHVTVYPRQIDVDNVAALAKDPAFTLVEDIAALSAFLEESLTA